MIKFFGNLAHLFGGDGPFKALSRLKSVWISSLRNFQWFTNPKSNQLSIILVLNLAIKMVNHHWWFTAYLFSEQAYDCPTYHLEESSVPEIENKNQVTVMIIGSSWWWSSTSFMMPCVLTNLISVPHQDAWSWETNFAIQHTHSQLNCFNSTLSHRLLSDADSGGCLAQFTGCLLGLLAKVAKVAPGTRDGSGSELLVDVARYALLKELLFGRLSNWAKCASQTLLLIMPASNLSRLTSMNGMPNDFHMLVSQWAFANHW